MRAAEGLLHTKARRSEQWMTKCFTKGKWVAKCLAEEMGNKLPSALQRNEFLNVLPVKGHVLTQSVIVENNHKYYSLINQVKILHIDKRR